MPGPITQKARILIVVAVFAGLGAGLYFLWPSDDADRSEATNQAQTVMLTVKQQAVKAGGPAAARSIFSKGLAAEQRGDQLRADGQYDAAAEAFRSATRHYRRALSVADSVAASARALDSSADETSSVSEAEIVRAQQEADSLREMMLRQKNAADEANADELATDLYEEALSTSNVARQAYQTETYDGYTTARERFARAHRLFQTSAELASDRHAAMTRREAVEQLREQVQTTTSHPEISGLIHRAESLRTEAHEEYERENYSRAAHLLEDVGMTYTRIRSVLDSVRAAQAEQAEQAQNRAAAEQARQAAQATRDDISDIGRHYPLYKKAQSIEREAQRLFEQRKFARAAKRFRMAEEQYQSIRNKPLPLDQARDVVHELVGRYQQALEEKNVYQLQELVPGLDARWWSDFFESAQNLMVSVDAGTLERTTNGATVSVRVRIDYMDEKNRMDHETFRNVWTLKPDNGNWMISSASMR